MAEVTQRRVGDLDLALLEAGGGGRPLMLCHGFTGAKEDFADFVDPFAAEGWWVVAPDLRGHGDSTQPHAEDAYSLATFADDLRALADHLGWEQFSLLGHSMGGMVAQHLAIDSPDRVDRLVLMDTCHGPVDGLSPDVVALAVDVLRNQGLPALLALIASLPASRRSPSEERLRSEREGYAAWADGKVHRCSPAMYAAMAQELCGRADRLADLQALTMPVRVVVGADDRDFLAPSLRMADAIPTADLVVIPDAAHSPQFENPGAWWDAVAAFLGADLLVD